MTQDVYAVLRQLRSTRCAQHAVLHHLPGQRLAIVLAQRCSNRCSGGFALALAELKADSAKRLALAEALLPVLHAHAPRVFERDDELRLNAERLTAIVSRPARAPERPRGSLHTSSLIVNAEGDQLLEHLRSEFDSADSVDLLCAFIKLSGYEKFRTELKRHCGGRGRSLRVLTTTHMGASDGWRLRDWQHYRMRP